MAIESNTLVTALQRSRLLAPEEMSRIDGLRDRYPEARALGSHLIQAGRLTPFQVNQLMQGREADLILGPYQLLERLGEGGMGQVFKARHQGMQRVVALKVIRRQLLSDPQAVGRFQREARAAAQLAHPNIVTVFDAGQAGDTHYLAMEYVQGIDLSALVKRDGPLPVDRACEYIRQAARGLHHAHEKGLVHRDVKPANLLLADDVIKLLDLGLARLRFEETEKASEPTLTQADRVMGTPDFMAPEQAKNARGADARADVYSLGCTLYFLLTGRAPFSGNSCMETLLNHQLNEAVSVRQARTEVPAALETILRRMMAKEPADRFGSAAEAADALERMADDDAAALLHARKPTRYFPGTRQRWWVAGAAGLLLASLTWAALPSASEPPPPAVSATPPPTVAVPATAPTRTESANDAPEDWPFQTMRPDRMGPDRKGPPHRMPPWSGERFRDKSKKREMK